MFSVSELVATGDGKFWRVIDRARRQGDMGFYNNFYDIFNDVTGECRMDMREFQLFPIKFPPDLLREQVKIV